jgi:phosphatidylglycerophosphate synthase
MSAIMPPDPVANRRPLASRQTRTAARAAALLTRAGVRPDVISMSGIVFAAFAALALMQVAPGPAAFNVVAAGWAPAWLIAAAFIQLRLAANLLDGMVAVEGGHGGRLGPLFNEIPDRIEDILIIAAFGAAAGAPALGLWTALAAILCAYLRLLGGAFGQTQSFAGPMAKQHRMAALTVGCIAGFGADLVGRGGALPALVLWVVCLGTVATAARRIRHIARLIGK